MKYFAIIGSKSYFISECESFALKNITFVNDKLCCFEIDNETPDILMRFSQIIKRGCVYHEKDIKSMLTHQSSILIGTKHKSDGLFWKKSLGNIKRFKEVDREHTDKEIKEKGVEVINIDTFQKAWGIVQGRQNISLYETVDFDRPVRSMNIGMMPAKLALLLINLGRGMYLQNINQKKKGTIWDPFVGLGTTGFLANRMGNNFIGSDINITPCKQNLRWRQQTQYATNNYFTVFKYDIRKVCTWKLIQHTDVVVTEGYLGPKIPHDQMPLKQLYINLDIIWRLYERFLEQMLHTFAQKINLVFTSPRYVQIKYGIGEKIQQWCQDHDLICESLSMYGRKGQKVGREIWRIRK